MKDNFVWGEIQPSDMRFHKDILKLGKLEISKKNNHIDGLSPHAKSSHMGWISPPKIHLILVESHLVGLTLPNTYLEMLCSLTEWINSHTQNAESHLTWLLRVTEVILTRWYFGIFAEKNPRTKIFLPSCGSLSPLSVKDVLLMIFVYCLLFRWNLTVVYSRYID